MTAAARRPTYPRAAVINRMIAVARANGIKVGGIEVDPDGTIRIIEKAESSASAYDRWVSGRGND